MSRDRRTVTLDWPHQVVAKSPLCGAERSPLHDANWRAHLA
jgi:hypothetical protein